MTKDVMGYLSCVPFMQKYTTSRFSCSIPIRSVSDDDVNGEETPKRAMYDLGISNHNKEQRAMNWMVPESVVKPSSPSSSSPYKAKISKSSKREDDVFIVPQQETKQRRMVA
jgi:hypothetical protein